MATEPMPREHAIVLLDQRARLADALGVRNNALALACRIGADGLLELAKAETRIAELEGDLAELQRERAQLNTTFTSYRQASYDRIAKLTAERDELRRRLLAERAEATLGDA